MTEAERTKAIAAHLAEHERKIVRQRKARIARNERNKRRGLQAAIARMMEA